VLGEDALRGLGPGSLLAMLTPLSASVETLPVDDALLALQGWERLISQAHAARAALLRRLDRAMADEIDQIPGRRDLDPARETGEEVALALAISGRAADTLLDVAGRLAELPATEAALAAGDLGVAHARVLVECLTGLTPQLPDALRRRLDAVLSDAALRLRLTPSQLRLRARRSVLAGDPDGSADRRRQAARGRTVSMRPSEQGMAWLSAYLPAQAAAACWQALDQHAHAGVGLDPDDPRGLGARRADTLVDLILTGQPDGNPPPDAAVPASVGVTLLVTVPASTLAGVGDEPAHLDSYGALDAALVRVLADQPGTVLHRLVTEPVTGRVLAVDPARYRPTSGVDRFVRLRDAVCRWPGCTRSARTCDLDHIVPWPDGPTTADNLIALCRGHHRLKTLGRFSISVGEHHVAVTSAARQVYWRHRHDPV
jgi:hypothetical protein